MSATHPADHSNPGASCLHTSHSAQSVLRLGNVKLPCQLRHTARYQTGDGHGEKIERTKEKGLNDGQFDNKNATFSFNRKS